MCACLAAFAIQAFSDYEGSLDAFEESFWQCYDVDLELIVEGASMENGKVFQVFEQINSYLLSHRESLVQSQWYYTYNGGERLCMRSCSF